MLGARAYNASAASWKSCHEWMYTMIEVLPWLSAEAQTSLVGFLFCYVVFKEFDRVRARMMREVLERRAGEQDEGERRGCMRRARECEFIVGPRNLKADNVSCAVLHKTSFSCKIQLYCQQGHTIIFIYLFY